MRETRSWVLGIAMVAAAALSCGCSGDETGSDGPPAPPPGSFEAEAAGSGPRLWLEAQLDGAMSATVGLWGAELGPVFGWSAHITGYGGEHLAPDGDPTVEPAALAPADPAQALGFAKIQRPTDIALGASRLSPELGEVTIDLPTELARVVLQPLGPGESELRIEQVVIRRSDGSYQTASVYGGVLTTAGGGQ